LGEEWRSDRPFNSRCQIYRRQLGWDGNLNSAIAAAEADGGVRRDRTDDLMLAKHALYQLSYDPSSKRGRLKLGAPRFQGNHRSLSVRPRVTRSVVGPGGLEPPTSRLSGVCSNQLSYRPLKRSAQTHDPKRAKRLNARSHHSLLRAAAVFTERETKTAASRTCLVFQTLQ
jgi:hypothetical protein